jgi:hypothetical protein
MIWQDYFNQSGKRSARLPTYLQYFLYDDEIDAYLPPSPRTSSFGPFPYPVFNRRIHPCKYAEIVIPDVRNLPGPGGDVLAHPNPHTGHDSMM